MGTKNNPGRFDCYQNAEPDEPMFVLLGRDKHAPSLVWLWSVLREVDGEDADKIAESRECMRAMLHYQLANGKQPVGLAECVIAGTLEMSRAANAAIKVLVDGKPKNPVTGIEQARIAIAALKLSIADELVEEKQK